MEEQLDTRVEAVSDAKPASEESTSDLIQLEETLSSAQDKAKKIVTLRLKLDEEAAASGEGSSSTEDAEMTGPVAPDESEAPAADPDPPA
jgi:hypothetical protein